MDRTGDSAGETPRRKSEQALTPDEVARRRHSLAASRLDAQFAQTAGRIRNDLSRITPESVASALNEASRDDAALLIAQARAWLDEFERCLMEEGLRAI